MKAICWSTWPTIFANQSLYSRLVVNVDWQACGTSTFQMLKWFEHVYSYDHGEVKLS